ncbi:MAG: CidA/LrgA family protein [Pseudomonadota bacterium]
MLNYLTLIFGCQLAGELMARFLTIPVPGPVMGMVILFLLLVVRGSVPDNLSKVTDGLLGHLSLLFVPAGVGVMIHFPLLGENWFAITVALIVSTVLTIAVTALMMSWLTKQTAIAHDEGTGGGSK